MQERGNGERTLQLMYDFVAAELVSQREKALRRTLRKVQREFPEIKPLLRDAKRFVRLTDHSLESEDLPKYAGEIRDKYFERGGAAVNLFEELVDIAQELKKYET